MLLNAVDAKVGVYKWWLLLLLLLLLSLAALLILLLENCRFKPTSRTVPLSWQTVISEMRDSPWNVFHHNELDCGGLYDTYELMINGFLLLAFLLVIWDPIVLHCSGII